MCLNVLFVSFYGVCAILGDGNLESHMYSKSFLIPLHPEEMKHYGHDFNDLHFFDHQARGGWNFKLEVSWEEFLGFSLGGLMRADVDLT